MPKTKIIASIGPASASEKVLLRMIREGVDLVRINYAHAVDEERENLIKLIKSIKDRGFRDQAQKTFKSIPYKSLYTKEDLKKLKFTKKDIERYSALDIINKRYETTRIMYRLYKNVEDNIKKMLSQRKQEEEQIDIKRKLTSKFKKDIVKFTSKYGHRLDIGGFLKHIRGKYLDILEKKEEKGILTQEEINKFTRPVYEFMKDLRIEETVIPDEKTMSNIINQFDDFSDIKIWKKIVKKPLKNKYDTILQKKIFELGKRFKGTEINLNKYMTEVLKGKFNLSDFTFTKAGPKRDFRDFT